jgi:hypothetical protein
MTSLFASQFGYASPYSLGPLDTGVPQVGVTLPKSKEKNTPGNTPEGANSIPGGESSMAASKAASNAASSALRSANNASVGQAGITAAARAGAISKAEHMNEPSIALSEMTAPSSPVTSPDAVPNAPALGPRNPGKANPTRTAPSSGGFGGFLHKAENFINETYNPVWQVTHPRQTFTNAENFLSNVFPRPVGMNSTPNTGGTRQSTDSGVTEPSNVYNPDGTSAYTGRSAVGGAGMRELPASPYSPQFRGFNYQNASGRAPYSPSGQQQQNEGGFSNEIENYLRDFNFSDV